MKITAPLWILSAGFLSLLPAENLGNISFVVGTAKIKKTGQEAWKDVRVNLPIGGGDQLQTGRAECVEISLSDGSVMRVGEESDVTVQSPSGKQISPAVGKGKIWANIKKLSKRNYDFEVTTGTATAAIRGTVFRVENSPADSQSSVMVYDGKVAVGPGGDIKAKMDAMKGERHEVSGPTEIPGPFEVSLMDWVTIVKGQQINIRRDGKFDKFKFNEKKDAEDPWVKFNRERDLALAKHEE